MKIHVKRPIELEVTHIRCVLPVNYGEEDMPWNLLFWRGRGGVTVDTDTLLTAALCSGIPLHVIERYLDATDPQDGRPWRGWRVLGWIGVAAVIATIVFFQLFTRD